MDKEAFRNAVALRRAGQVHKAREICHLLLQRYPDDIELQLFACEVEVAAGAPELALRLIERVLAKRPDLPSAYFNKGVVLQSVRRLDDALDSYARATSLDPTHAMAHYNSGVILQALGRHAEAAAQYATTIRLQPDYLDALFNFGTVSNSIGQYAAAADAFDKLLKRVPQDASVWFNYALSLYWGGEFERSLVAIDRALTLNSSSADLRCARAMVLEALGRNAEAVSDYERAFAAGFRDAQAFNRYGNLLLGFNRAADAVRALSIAAELAPTYADIFNNRGVAFELLGDNERAFSDFRTAVSLQPNFIEAHSNAANCAMRLGLVDETLVSLRNAMSGEATTNSQIEARDRAIGLNIFFRRQICLWDGLGTLEEDAARRIRNEGVAIDPFKALVAFDDPGLHRLCADRAAGAGLRIQPLVQVRTRQRGSKLRIAYLSADFHDHATTRLMAELFELHDRSRFDVLAYSYGRDDGSAMRRRIVAAFDAFHDVAQLSDRQIADKIASDGIDILIDLKGHTRESRLDILKHRPAPIQAHYIGFPGTLGGGLVDYMIADSVTVPFDQSPFYAEAIVHLPFCYQVNDRRREVSPDTPTRSACDLPDDAFVFCGFAQPFKLSPDVFDAWLDVLNQVPRSVLWLLAYNEEMRENLRRECISRGVDGARLVFAAPADLATHLARHKLADLFLDTWPYGAHTSASDALWVGLPVLTWSGRSFASRVSSSLLQAIGASELIAPDKRGYVAAAVRFANSANELATVRSKIESNRDLMPLFDTDRFRAGIEAAYAEMWQIHERGESPHHIAIAPT